MPKQIYGEVQFDFDEFFQTIRESIEFISKRYPECHSKTKRFDSY